MRLPRRFEADPPWQVVETVGEMVRRAGPELVVLSFERTEHVHPRFAKELTLLNSLLEFENIPLELSGLTTYLVSVLRYGGFDEQLLPIHGASGDSRAYDPTASEAGDGEPGGATPGIDGTES